MSNTTGTLLADLRVEEPCAEAGGTGPTHMGEPLGVRSIQQNLTRKTKNPLRPVYLGEKQVTMTMGCACIIIVCVHKHVSHPIPASSLQQLQS